MNWKILLIILLGALLSIVKGYSLTCIGKILPLISELPKDVTAIQGRTSSILCRAKSCFGDQLTYQWLDPQRRDLSKRRGFSVKGGLLTIFNVSRSSEGEYTCRVEDEYGEDEASLRLEVLVRPRILQMGNLIVEENSSATFECSAEGVPKLNLTIRKDGSDVPFRSGDNRVRLGEYDDGGFKVLQLTISDVKRSDDGLYLCQASNGAGRAVKAGRLEVQFKPDMSPTPARVVKAWSANPGNLTCIAEANPKASLVWKFRGVSINQSDERYQIFGVQSQSSLLFRTYERSVFGKYTCEAQNPLGNGSVAIILEEVFAPGPVAKIVFYRVTPTSITFLFRKPVGNGSLPITNYIMRYRASTDSLERTVYWTKGSDYVLRGLKPRTKYQFSVAACNDVGKGPWKKTERVMPVEKAPEPPTVITVSRYPKRLEVSWEVPEDNGEPIIMFEIQFFKVVKFNSGWLQANQSTRMFFCTNWKPTPSVELTGLQPDTFYKVQIRAVNKIGKSLPGCIVVKTRIQEEFWLKLSFTTVVVVVFLVILFCVLFEVLRARSLGKMSIKTPQSCRIVKKSTKIIKSMFGIREARPDLTEDENLKNNVHRFPQVDLKDSHHKQACEVSYIVV